jgi:twitching motility protein PilT
MATMHTTDAKETIGRFMDAFPHHQHLQVRQQLSTNLRAVISQRLIPRADGTGRVLVAEIMVVTAVLRECILDSARGGEIISHIEKGHSQYGMQTFDQALVELVERKIITVDEALKNATSPNDFRLKMTLR